jgi:hypothetical protein
MSIENLVEVTLNKPDDFLKVIETLSRIGVASKTEKVLWQSCHILHKQGRYFILHFKQLFELDGKPTNITENDLARVNTIANLLNEWGLVNLVNPQKSQNPQPAPLSQIKIISYAEKKDWILEQKYSIGKKRKME